MLQIQNMQSTPGCRDASTCGFSARKGRRAHGFRNLPHTSDGRFRKCGEKPRSTDQTPVLRFRDLRFCCRKSGYAQRFPIFPALPELMPQTESSSYSGSIRDNIQLSWKRQKAVGGNPDNDPSLPLPDVESATTGLCSNLYTRSGNYSSAISTSRPAEALRSFAYSSPHEL